MLGPGADGSAQDLASRATAARPHDGAFTDQPPDNGTAQPLDIVTALRTLRPIRSKLQALSRALLLPSGRPAVSTTAARTVRGMNADGTGTGSFETAPGMLRVVRTYGGTSGRHMTGQAGAATAPSLRRRGRPPKQAPDDRTMVNADNTLAESLLVNVQPLADPAHSDATPDVRKQMAAFAPGGASGLPSPIRRHGLYLRMFFKDALRKFHSRAMASSSEKTQHQTVPSLGELASYAVGAQIELLPELDEQEAIYEEIAGHFRRYVLVAHLCQLCIMHVHVGSIVQELTDVCMALGAREQALQLIAHALSLHPADSSLETMLHRCRRLRAVRRFIDMCISVLTVKWIAAAGSRLLSIAQTLTDPTLACLFARKVVDHLLEEGSDEESHVSPFLAGPLASWTAVLIFRSFELRCDTTGDMFHELMLRMDGKASLDVQCVLGLRLLMTERGRSDDDDDDDDYNVSSISHAISLIRTGFAKSTIHFLFYSFGTIDRLFEAATVLRSAQLPTVALEILKVLTGQYGVLVKQQQAQQMQTTAVQTSFADCRKLMVELEGATAEREATALGKKKFYDADFDVWVVASTDNVRPSSSSIDAPSSSAGIPMLPSALLSGGDYTTSENDVFFAMPPTTDHIEDDDYNDEDDDYNDEDDDDDNAYNEDSVDDGGSFADLDTPLFEIRSGPLTDGLSFDQDSDRNRHDIVFSESEDDERRANDRNLVFSDFDEADSPSNELDVGLLDDRFLAPSSPMRPLPKRQRLRADDQENRHSLRRDLTTATFLSSPKSGAGLF